MQSLQKRLLFGASFSVSLTAALFQSTSAYADANSLDKARSLYERIASVPPTQSVLQNVASLYDQGRIQDAAQVAMQDPAFYNVTLKAFFKRWFNVNGVDDTDLNDGTATALGMVRDDIPFDRALYDDILYVANDDPVNGIVNLTPPPAMGMPTPPPAPGPISQYQTFSNNMYLDLQQTTVNGSLVDLSDPTKLVRRLQSDFTGNPDTAGLITTRAFGEAYFSAGTNRRVVRYMLKNFLCRDLENISDTTVPDYRVRRDVDRSPGGNSLTFKNYCVGCHAQMDAFAGATALFNFQNNQLENYYQTGAIPNKFNQNANVFPGGFQTTNDSWRNLSTTGQNSVLGWRQPADGTDVTSGVGIKSLGKVFAATKAFSACMTEQVFERFCLRNPKSTELAQLLSISSQFENNNYNFKGLIAEVTTQMCPAYLN